jgi:AraC-like DNA-binding protein
MHYRELAPIPQLAAAVDRIWLLEGEAPPAGAPAEPILPDGRPELILHFGDPFERLYVGGTSARQAHVLYAGQVTTPLVLRPTGRVAVVGVRFRPDGAAAILTHPQDELAGLTLAVDAISAPLRRALLAVEDSADDLTQAAASVQTILARWLQPARIDPRVRFAVERIERSRGRASVDYLAVSTGISRRHLERRFLESVGMTPKRLARVTRFQHAIQTLQRAEPRGRGAATAAACGYADQSHFIRDFREFAGCSPAEHLLRDGLLTGFFIDT